VLAHSKTPQYRALAARGNALPPVAVTVRCGEMAQDSQSEGGRLNTPRLNEDEGTSEGRFFAFRTVVG
jgi:hypothetical protein